MTFTTTIYNPENDSETEATVDFTFLKGDPGDPMSDSRIEINSVTNLFGFDLGSDLSNAQFKKLEELCWKRVKP